MQPHENLILEPEIVVNSFRQEVAIAGIAFINSLLDNLWRLVVAAVVGYVVYLMIVLGTPATPIAPTSTATPEQHRDSFGWSMAALTSAAVLPLCYVDWRTRWRRMTTGVKRALG